MIIKALIELIIGVFRVLTLPISIPSMPDGVKEFIATALDYMTTGIAVLSNYCDINYLLVLFGVVIAVDVGISLYRLVMWVLRKIPMLGIE